MGGSRFENYPFGLIIGQKNRSIGCAIHIRNVNRYLDDNKASLAWVKSLEKQFTD